MSAKARVFVLIEAALALLLGYQIISNPPTLAFSILGALSVCWANSLRRKNWLRTPLFVFGIIALVVTIFINPTVWWMILIGIIAVLSTGRQGFGALGVFPWFKKQFISIRSAEENADHSTQRRPWFGDFVVGQSVYEWDDVNLTLIAGDTIVDLGNTILPKRDNVVMIRKGFGKTRLLVPIGIGIELNHSALIGNVTFAGQTHPLRNETIRLFSDDYESAPRHIRIVTSAFIGDLEVVPV
ncbi:cell wall-active antibiotics response protein LiaF [Lacticaseibacillus hulanensis]|uniref:cell wall-active antibiotics response protein LiaF n=1 Tax=Lacticaseibacillus hulanensis TaxID=2493111 RepID=UPI000FD86428|nr:cell wall-active antibiotics response protein LiaF [Lacticaseibacillus hulanensis]